MAGSRLQIVAWQLRRSVDAVSRVMWVAIGLVLVEIFLYFGPLPALAKREAALLDDALRHRQAKVDPSRTKPAPQLLSGDMVAFYKTLPRASESSKILRRVHEIADDAGVWIDQADYRPVKESGAKLVLYQMTLPTKGTYPELRQFLARAIREVPGLAVEGVSFQRQRVGEAELDAQIKLTLFMSVPGT